MVATSTATVGQKRLREEPEDALEAGAIPVAVPTPTPGGPTSTPGGSGAGATTSTDTSKTVSEFSPQLLQIYYDQMFPYGHMFAWLSYLGDPSIAADETIQTKYWRKREFCFTMKDDVYIRYQSYNTMGEFRSQLKKKCPYKIDLGAIYNAEPKKKSSCVSFIAEEKELVFDIDITDYDDVRHCCSGGAVCNECWPLMTCAIKVLNLVFEKTFGFENKLWVFSGRRGIHCWVCDPGTQKYTGRIRTAVIHFLHTFVGSEGSAFKVDLDMITSTGYIKGIHQMYQDVYPICLEYFKKCIIQNQDLFLQPRKTPEGEAKLGELKSYFHIFCSMIRDPHLQRELWETVDNLNKKGKISSSEMIWDLTESLFEKYRKKYSVSTDGTLMWQGYAGKTPAKRAGPVLLRANMMELVFSYSFPRVDVEVTKAVNHLLKSPFCAHPKTGKICVPMDSQNIDSFDPCNQPTLRTIHDELVETGDPAKTAIGSAIEVFERTFLNGLREACRVHPDFSQNHTES